MSERGFTLIELLVVIAIITILAGILFPVFAKARAKGEQTACLSNIRQLCLAALEYASDHSSCFPIEPRGHVVPDWASSSAEANWARSLMPYIMNDGIYQCPSVGEDDVYPPTPGRPAISYVYNCEMGGPEGAIDTPTLKVLLWDTGTLAGASQAWGWRDGEQGCTFPQLFPNWEPPHSEGRNYAFCDGHAKWLLDRYAETQADVLGDGPFD